MVGHVKTLWEASCVIVHTVIQERSVKPVSINVMLLLLSLAAATDISALASCPMLYYFLNVYCEALSSK